MNGKIFILFFTCISFIVAEEYSIQVHSAEKYEELSQFSKFTIQKYLPEIQNSIGSSESNIRLILVNSEDEFQSYTGAKLPEWVSAVTIFPTGIIVIKTPDLANSTLSNFRTTIVHELVHAVHGQYVPLNLAPLWFTEGLAIYLSEGFDMRSRIVVSRALAKKRLIPLDQLSNSIRYSRETAELSYAETGTVIEYLVLVYGREVLKDIFQNMRSGKDFTVSVSLATNIDAADFEYYWKSYVTKKYQWVFLLDFQYILSFAMTLLVILAYLSIRSRNKKTVRQWEEQEQNEEVYFGKI